MHKKYYILESCPFVDCPRLIIIYLTVNLSKVKFVFFSDFTLQLKQQLLVYSHCQIEPFLKYSYPVSAKLVNDCMMWAARSRSLVWYCRDMLRGCPKTQSISSPCMTPIHSPQRLVLVRWNLQQIHQNIYSTYLYTEHTNLRAKILQTYLYCIFPIRKTQLKMDVRIFEKILDIPTLIIKC